MSKKRLQEEDGTICRSTAEPDSQMMDDELDDWIIKI